MCISIPFSICSNWYLDYPAKITPLESYSARIPAQPVRFSISCSSPPVIILSERNHAQKSTCCLTAFLWSPITDKANQWEWKSEHWLTLEDGAGVGKGIDLNEMKVNFLGWWQYSVLIGSFVTWVQTFVTTHWPEQWRSVHFLYRIILFF